MHLRNFLMIAPLILFPMTLNAKENTKINPEKMEQDPHSLSVKVSGLDDDLKSLASKYRLRPEQIEELKDDIQNPDGDADTKASDSALYEQMRANSVDMKDIQQLERINHNGGDGEMADLISLKLSVYRMTGTPDNLATRMMLLNQASSMKQVQDDMRYMPDTDALYHESMRVPLNRAGLVTAPFADEVLNTKSVVSETTGKVTHVPYGHALYVTSPDENAADNRKILVGFHDLPCVFHDNLETASPTCKNTNLYGYVDRKAGFGVISGPYEDGGRYIGVYEVTEQPVASSQH